jgi:methanogenic corrinoid protein MtbC1
VITDDVRARYCQHLLARDAAGATAMAVGLIDAGTSSSEVLLELVAPALAEIGRRWQRNELTVVDEHAASAIAERTIAVLASIGPPPTQAPSVVVACAAGEWHVLPALLLSEVLRDGGLAVEFVGASVPPAHLGEFLRRVGPDLVVLSCTTPFAYDGVVAMAHVAHDVGVPVAAGGRALADRGTRARVLGADLWAPDAPALLERLGRPLPKPTTEPTADTGTAMELALRREEIISAAMGELVRRHPPMQEADREARAHTRQHLVDVLRFVEAAALCRDPSVVDEHARWTVDVLTNRRIPVGAMRIGVDALMACAEHGMAVKLLERVRQAVPVEA